MAERFRFRPRFRGLAFGALATGLGAAGLGAARGATAAIIAGCVLTALGLAYLRSPAWRYAITIDDDALEVSSAGERRFRLPWAAVVRVLASPATETCFVDGGSPDLSLLVPGDGAPAPYDVERRRELYRAIMARVPADRIREVATLEAARDTSG